MNTIAATAEYGIVIRRRALVENGISYQDVLAVMEKERPLDSNDHLISFGPSFGDEAMNEFHITPPRAWSRIL